MDEKLLESIPVLLEFDVVEYIYIFYLWPRALLNQLWWLFYDTSQKRVKKPNLNCIKGITFAIL